MFLSRRIEVFLLFLCVTGVTSVAYADTILTSNTYMGTRHVNGIPLTTQNGYFYGASDTAAATAAKTVTISSIDASSLNVGQVIVVNPASTSTATTAHTLSLNSGTAKPIYYNGAAVNTAALGAKVWTAGVPSTFVYDGTNWVFAGSGGESGQTYNAFGGANGSVAGTAGLVPAPAATDNTKFLRGDGTWGTPTNTTYSAFGGANGSVAGSAGLVPAPAATDDAKFLRGDGTWGTPTNTTYSAFGGANGSVAGSAGLVPAPAATDNTKFLRGDGTWATVNLPISNGAPSSNSPTGSAEIWLQ